MSIAMAATLFATNSITIFAEEGDPIEAISVAPAAEEDNDDEIVEAIESEPEETPEESEPETYKDDFPPYEDMEDTIVTPEYESEVYYNCWEGVLEKDIEQTKETYVYYSDKEDVEENGAQGNDNVYSEVKREDIDKENDKVDYVENTYNEEPTFDQTTYLIYYDPEAKEIKKATGLKADGTEVTVELTGDLDKIHFKPVEVMIAEDGSVRELHNGDFRNLHFGKFVDGEFVYAWPGDPTAAWYYYAVEGSTADKDLKATETLYYDTNDETYLDKEVYEAITAETLPEGSKYQKVVEYTATVDGEQQSISKDELENKDGISDLNQWGYTIDAVEEKLDVEETITPQKGHTNVHVAFKKIEVTSVNRDSVTAKCYFVAEDSDGNSHTYVADEMIIPRNELGKRRVSEGDVLEYDLTNPKNDHRVGGSITAQKVLIEAQPEQRVNSIVIIKDENGEEVWSGTEEAYEAILAEKYTKVIAKADKLRYELKAKEGQEEPEYVYVDPGLYAKLRENVLTYEVTHAFFYTVQDKNNATNVLSLDIDGKTYELTVNFWENKRIGNADVRVVYPSADDKATDPYLVIKFQYAGYNEDGEYEVIDVTYGEEDDERIYVTADAFGPEGKGSVELKYTPSYDTYVYPTQELKVKLKAVSFVADRALPNELLLSEEELENRFDILPTEFGNEYYSTVLGPVVKFTPTPAQPQPNPNPNPGPNPDVTPDTTPSTPTTIDVTPVALAAAPAGQVLGAQREEPVAGEAPAVLGASRARGTADETTAPFVRVLVMAAVASAALFLTRKREEEN
jgi:hypothetical protein